MQNVIQHYINLILAQYHSDIDICLKALLRIISWALKSR